MIVVGIVIGFIIGVIASAKVHQRRLKQQKFDSTQSNLTETNSQEINLIQQRHQEQIQQLKRQHLEELNQLQSQLAQAYQHKLQQSQSNTTTGTGTNSSDSLVLTTSTAKSNRTSLKLADLPRLNQSLANSNHPQRQQAIMAIASIADLHGDRAEFITTIPILAQSIGSRDSNIRKASVFALSKIKSEKVIPVLKIALKDTNLEVVQLASKALSNFKFYPTKTKFVDLKKSKNIKAQPKINYK